MRYKLDMYPFTVNSWITCVLIWQSFGLGRSRWRRGSELPDHWSCFGPMKVSGSLSPCTFPSTGGESVSNREVREGSWVRISHCRVFVLAARGLTMEIARLRERTGSFRLAPERAQFRNCDSRGSLSPNKKRGQGLRRVATNLAGVRRRARVDHIFSMDVRSRVAIGD